MNLCFYGDRFTEDPDGFGSINKLPAKSALGLVAYNNDRCFRHPEIMPQVMEDPSRIAHARSGNDHAGTFESIKRHGFFRRR